MFTQKCCLSWRSLQHCQGPLICHRIRHARRISGPILPMFVNKASAMPRGVIRRYQVVVAATRDMGIGKDGKLPWTLPSDLRYFKEVTTTTSVAGMRNAVIMGRKTWESIPLKYRPLPGRLNVVLSRSGKMGLAALEDLVICTDLNSALKFLAEPPVSLSVEKVFIIGGGQVLKETLNATGCEAIHLTDIKTNVECDTFIPRIDSSSFVPLLSSKEIVENNIQFSFLTYVRMNNSAEDRKLLGKCMLNLII
ncbi:bifunctional dihydrofolate reductase-thymidylate synthase-like isoform X2 [Silene latifolia]|uniref:bifunctional dihydrofolate reductase-thymidylate synthase-like isoform X2 n=1 Tax=Silene latifolia TaxID=37657 RepID=UPI003D78040F